MNQADLVKDMSDTLDLPQAKVQRVLDLYHQHIRGELMRGAPVRFRKIGSLVPTVRKRTRKVNPQTLELMELGERIRISFRPTRTFISDLDSMQTPDPG